MSFSSPDFLFAFLPLFFFAYYLTPPMARNSVLLLGSLAFYAAEGVTATGILIVSIISNQIIGAILGRSTSIKGRLMLLWAGILLNLAPLIYYKYWTFLTGAGREALHPFGLQFTSVAAHIVLPAGLSFFTFQGMSYLIDIYRNEIVASRSLIDFGMYHALFPQVIAGPIVRYAEVADRIDRRPIALAGVEAGILLFCYGLAKKIIIADNLNAVVGQVFDLPFDQLGAGVAWAGALSYTLQIYFDFSGYSDMAIGLGLMLGFVFPKNFDLPYRSRSITEFWRRWHITLTRWFRDYLYIPLGGNRAGSVRTYANLLIVFVLCGLWHGAAYTFLIWGCYHGVLLIIERLARGTRFRLPVPLAWVSTLFLVVVGWVIFRSPTLESAGHYLVAMAGLNEPGSTPQLSAFFTPDKIMVSIIGAILSVAPPDRMRGWPSNNFFALTQRVWALLLLIYSCSQIAENGFTPFIYFRF